MKLSLKILHIEDSWQDSELVQNLLQEGGFDCTIKRVETHGELVEALENSTYDLILSDCTLPQFHGLKALEIAHARKPDVPFIFLSGTIGEEVAIESLQNGATDYVLKHRISRLVPAVRRALLETHERVMRRTVEDRLHQARRMEAIGTLAGGLVHDFNNLLQVIKMNASLIPLKLDDRALVVEISQNLIKASDRGAYLIRELSAFSRQTETHLISVDSTRAIKETTGMLHSTLPPKVQLILQLGENLPSIHADPSHLDRILTNLIMNAKDAMPDGGPITLSAEVVQFDPSPRLSSATSNIPYLCIKIADRGTGMDEATRLRAFEPFFTTKPVGKGTGLGLAVVFGLMQAHNGFIDITSAVGVGTTVALFFPLAQDSIVTPGSIKKIPPIQLWNG